VSTLAVVVLVVVGVLLLLAVGGAIANARRRRADAPRLEVSLDEVNRALAAAHAEDKGWEPEALNAAARRFFAERRPDARVREQALILVDDRPGTDEDRAVFRFVSDDGVALLTLGRVRGEWVAESLE
jgi:hypothetical protein